MPDQTPRALFACFQRNAMAGQAGLDEEMLADDVVMEQPFAPEVIIAEYRMVATMPGSGTRGTAPFVVVLRARDGLIVHWREYQDRAAIAEAMA